MTEESALDKVVVRLRQLYRDLRWPLEELIFPMMLLLWPLIKITNGVDVSDSTYSLGNYLYPDTVQIMWRVSTYLSNAFGAMLVRLPGGMTLIGANIYTGLVASAIALICYYALRGDFTAPVLWAGEMFAIGLCWIPTGILYNYMTYLLFTVGAVLIYRAIRDGSSLMLCLAGIVLGLNVFVRVPNVTEAALIVVVWAGIIIRTNIQSHGLSRKNTIGSIISATGYCLLGYFVGLCIPLVVIIARFGTSGMLEMIEGLTGISGTDDTYSTTKMLLAILSAYARSLKWSAIIVAVVFMGTLMFAAFNKTGYIKWIKRLIYVGIIALMLRFFWGRGMYTFRYYEDYTAMYEWGMILIILAWICAVTVLVRRDYNLLVKLYAVITVVILLITPLGSNNNTYQNLNNMFLVVPFELYVIGGWLSRGAHQMRMNGVLYGCNFPWMSTVIVLICVAFVQVSLFHVDFVFRDGMDGAKRDAKVTGIDSLAGMRTTRENAMAIEGLAGAIDGDVTQAVYWGDCPGLAYILRIPSAISSTWPDLDSYPTATFEAQLMDICNDDANSVAIIWRKLPEPSGYNGAAKQDVLFEYIESMNLKPVYENEEYVVYR